MTLTSRQSAILAYIQLYAAQEGFSPSLRDIARKLGITQEGVRKHLAALEAKGAIRRTPYVARSIRVVDKPLPSVDSESVLES